MRRARRAPWLADVSKQTVTGYHANVDLPNQRAAPRFRELLSDPYAEMHRSDAHKMITMYLLTATHRCVCCCRQFLKALTLLFTTFLCATFSTNEEDDPLLFAVSSLTSLPSSGENDAEISFPFDLEDYTRF